MKRIAIVLFSILISCSKGEVMQIDKAQEILLKTINDQSLNLETLTLKEGLEIFELFYKNFRFDDCDLDADGDMLLYEWGTYSWNGNQFQISLGRQFISNIEEDDDAIKQLHLLFFYPDGTFDEDISGNQWFSNPSNTNEILSFVNNQEVFSSLLNTKPVKVEIDFGGV